MESLIPAPKIIERLQFENPWWLTGQIQEIYRKMDRRLYFDLFFPYVEDPEVNRALILMGPRRVGKTVMLYHSVAKLLERKVPDKDIFFIGIDNPVYMNLGLEDILALCLEAVNRQHLKGCFVFFDEIQYLKNWEQHLKVLVDHYPETKFIASGSAAAALRLQSTESGAGRFTDFMLPPLTFQEFIHLRGKAGLIDQGTILYDGKKMAFSTTNNLTVLNQEFIDYINFGGYPEVVLSEKIQSEMGRFVKSDIVDKVLLRDLPSLYGIRDVQELNRFFTYLAYNTGNECFLEKMSKDSGINKETIRKYLEYLEAAFLIKVLNKVDVNAKHFKRITGFKVYLTNSSLHTALFSPVAAIDDIMGNMAETILIAQWMHRENLNLKYARWKSGRREGEVDLVLVDNRRFKPLWGVEIKWTNRYFEKPAELRSLKDFCATNHLPAALVTTIDKSGNHSLGDLELTFVPAALYAYNIGWVTLQQKGNWLQGGE